MNALQIGCMHACMHFRLLFCTTRLSGSDRRYIKRHSNAEDYHDDTFRNSK